MSRLCEGERGVGWTALEPGVYLHKGWDDTAVVIAGQVTPAMAGVNVVCVLSLQSTLLLLTSMAFG